jgi:hypothetical protein
MLTDERDGLVERPGEFVGTVAGDVAVDRAKRLALFPPPLARLP